jgi:LysM repeat protein
MATRKELLQQIVQKFAEYDKLATQYPSIPAGLSEPNKKNLDGIRTKLAPILKPATPATPANPETHVVAAGETLPKLAEKFGVSEADLKNANTDKLKTWGTVQGFNAGETIKIPKKGSAPAEPVKPVEPATPETPANPETHVVAAGETLPKLAEKFGVSEADLKAANTDKLKTWGTAQGFNAGETIKIPKKGSAPATPVTPVTPETTPSGADLGAGAENTDAYESQRDNKMLDLKNSTSSYNGGKESGDVQCNVTSLAMQLVGLADGDKAKVIKLVKAQLEKRKATIDPGWGLEEMLGTLVDKLGISIFGASGLAAVCKLLPELVKSTEIIYTFDKATFASKIVPALKAGAEIIFSGKFTSGGHICSLLGVRSDGIVINDPYGCNLAQGVYFKNGAVGNKANLETYKNTLARRLSLSGALQSVIDAATAGKPFAQNIGKQNFYSWDDVTKVGLKWMQIAYKA